MTCNARVVLIDHGQLPRPDLIADLEACGCTIEALAPGDTDAKAVRERGANVVVILAGDAPEPAIATARGLKADALAEHIPIVVLGNAAEGALDAAVIDGVIDDRLPGESVKTEMAARLRSLARLHVMRSELARRETIERRYGLSNEPTWTAPIDSAGMRVLAAGDFGADAQALSEIVGDPSRLAFVADARGAIDALSEGRFEAAVVAVNGAADAWLTMCGDIRDNPRLFNLPILMVADADSFPDPSAPFREGATDLLLRPFEADSLRSRMALLIKQQRYRARMQDAYRRSPHLETSDSLTGLYSYGFLHDYLGELIAGAEPWGRPVSAGVFDIKGMAGINRRYGYAAGDRLLRQAGGLIGRLVRGEDLTARHGGQAFCVVMPETPRETAGRVLRRIADVVGQTEFGVLMAKEPVVARLKLGCAGIEPGDSAETLIARARAAMA